MDCKRVQEIAGNWVELKAMAEMTHPNYAEVVDHELECDECAGVMAEALDESGFKEESGTPDVTDVAILDEVLQEKKEEIRKKIF